MGGRDGWRRKDGREGGRVTGSDAGMRDRRDVDYCPPALTGGPYITQFHLSLAPQPKALGLSSSLTPRAGQDGCLAEGRRPAVRLSCITNKG